MSNTRDTRWQQRLESLEKALTQLDEACHLSTYTNLQRAGLIQTFEFSFELAWKTLKDLLFYEGFDVKSPREVIRQAFEAGYLTEDDAESLLDALDKRNLLSHTYQEAAAREAEQLIKNRYAPALQQLRDTLRKKRSA